MLPPRHASPNAGGRKMHLRDGDRPACRAGKRTGADRLDSTTDGRLVTCLACRALVVEDRRERTSAHRRDQGALLDVTEGRPNVIRLHR